MRFPANAFFFSVLFRLSVSSVPFLPLLPYVYAGNPVLSVYLNPERKFAFVEFGTIELANAFIDVSLSRRKMHTSTLLHAHP